MAVYTYEIASEFNFPNITVYNRFRDGELTGWRINANEGYVFYDPNEEFFEPQLDPETGLPMEDENGDFIEIQVNHYFRVSYLPLRYNFDNFPYIAVLESEVDENYIFGGNNNDNEVI